MFLTDRLLSDADLLAGDGFVIFRRQIKGGKQPQVEYAMTEQNTGKLLASCLAYLYPTNPYSGRAKLPCGHLSGNPEYFSVLRERVRACERRHGRYMRCWIEDDGTVTID